MNGARSTSADTAAGFASGLTAWFARRAADQRTLWAHLRGRWYAYLPAALAWLVAHHYLLFNLTASLAYHVVWLHPFGTDFARGDLIVYRYAGEELMHLKKGQRFFKRIVGLPGDRVSVEGRRVLINDIDVGFARQYTLEGHRLEPPPPGVIPAKYFYVQGTHEMSFDSRYRASGLVHVNQIIGKVEVIF
jgi:conjugal transfer pilin signal peptidase TrbI